VGANAAAVLFFLLLVKALLLHLHRSRPFTTRASAREENSLTPRELLYFSRLLTSSSSSAAQSSIFTQLENACGKKVASSPAPLPVCCQVTPPRVTIEAFTS
jgi:hypothetical protein